MKLLSGRRAFILQRSSAVVLLAYLSAGALRVAFGPPVSFVQWQAWSAQPLSATALLGLALAVLAHAWVGIRDVVLDYVHSSGLRLAVLGVVAAALILLAVWTILVLVVHMIST
jgi:succinate dehydrogenase / fumarate reductase, membrane anchor subunit